MQPNADFADIDVAAASKSGDTTGGEVHIALERVIQRRQIAWIEPQGASDQPVGEPGVLRQQGSMQVGADRVAVHRSLQTAVPVIAIALQNSPERPSARAEMGAPAVVLKAGQQPVTA